MGGPIGVLGAAASTVANKNEYDPALPLNNTTTSTALDKIENFRTAPRPRHAPLDGQNGVLGAAAFMVANMKEPDPALPLNNIMTNTAPDKIEKLRTAPHPRHAPLHGQNGVLGVPVRVGVLPLYNNILASIIVNKNEPDPALPLKNTTTNTAMEQTEKSATAHSHSQHHCHANKLQYVISLIPPSTKATGGRVLGMRRNVTKTE